MSAFPFSGSMLNLYLQKLQLSFGSKEMLFRIACYPASYMPIDAQKFHRNEVSSHNFSFYIFILHLLACAQG